MDWSYPTKQMLAQDASGMGVVLDRLAREVGEPPVSGTRFLYSAGEMLDATRAIEDALAAGDRLAVGFQTFDKFRREIPVYHGLVQRGVHVTAFAQMTEAAGDNAGARRELFGMRWVELSPHRRHLENQWFLVAEGTQPIAFVGYDISAPEHIAEGGITDPNRHFTGFVSDDERVVTSLLQYLDGVAGVGAVAGIGVEAVEAARTASVRTILCATDEGDASYRRAREAAVELARLTGASLLLYDRTAESYLADPYPYPDVVGPERLLSRLDAFRLGRTYLADQIDEGVAAGVTTSAWLPMTPGPKGLTGCVDRFRPDLIIMPSSLERGSLINRVRGNVLPRFRAATGVPIWTVDERGRMHVAASSQPLPA